jgi:protein phosphatase
MNIKSAGKTDIGLVREINEDCIKLLPDKNLYIVCDGMGGHKAGEVASSTACDTISSLYGNFFDRLLTDEQVRLPRVFPSSTDVLTKAVRIANHSIYRQASTNPSFSGMGTTVVVVAIEKDILTALHVGDSRIYCFHSDTLTPLTVDHSWAAELEQSEQITPEEAKNLVNRNVITRALGVKERVEIDVAIRKIHDNDIYILCSDGLCGFVDDSDIREVVKRCNNDVEKIVSNLVQMANDRGGQDNVTVAAIQIKGRVDRSDLQEMATVTVDGEPIEYFEAEEQWAASATTESKPEENQVETSSEKSGRGKYIVFSIIVLALIILFYLVLKD